MNYENGRNHEIRTIRKRSWPEQLTDHVSVFGNDHFRHYLVGGYQDVLIACGVTASAKYFTKSLADSGWYVPDKRFVMQSWK